MPELPLKRLSVIDTVKKIPPYMRDEQKKALAEGGLEWIGSGAQSIVIIDPRNPQKVISIDIKDIKKTPEDAKKIFYTHKIFSTLFPHNFPQIYAATGTNDADESSHYAGTVRERIISKKKLHPMRRAQTRYPFSKVEKICRKWHIPLLHDISEKNLMLGSDGGEYYVDQLIPVSASRFNSTLSYMKQNNYSDADITKVQASIKKLGEIKS